MNRISVLLVTLILGIGSSDSFAQAKKSSKAKGKASTSKAGKASKPKEKMEPVTEQKTEAVTEAPPVIEPSAPIEPTAEFTKPTTAPEAAEPATPTTPAALPNEPATTVGGSHLFGLQAALGVPHPLRAGLVYMHPNQLFSAELNYGAFSIGVDAATAKMSNYELGLRWHPFAGSFYAGALIGSRTLSVEKKEIIQTQDIVMKAEIKSNYLAPNIGWMWGADNGGFFASMDLGVLLPSSVNTTFSSNADSTIQQTSDYIKLDKDVRDVGNKLGEVTLPLWTLVKLGWLF